MFKWLRNLFSPEFAEAYNSAMHPESTIAMEKARRQSEVGINVTEPKKEASLPDFNNMSKKELCIWAKENLNISVDKRRKKDYIIDQINKNLNNKES